ncbi:MAG: cytochrome P450 [Chloroflexi bacterium]|nr:cytochrome P450 [Chloroflexota bacterium]
MTVIERPLAPVSLRDLHDVDPYPAYERIRAVGPVTWDAGMAAWLVVSHAECTIVERREDLFEEPTGSLPGAAEIVGERDFRSLVGGPHEVLHRAVSHAWRPDPIAPLAMAAVRLLVAERIAGLAERPTIEVYEDLARFLPIAVVARVLGLPDRDAATLEQAKGWMEAVLAWRHSYGEDPDARAAAIQATRQLDPLLLDTVRARRDRPEADAISLLWETGRQVAPDWHEQDVMDNAKFLFEGGSETTAFLICNTLHRLFEESAERRAAVLREPADFARFLEEVLRHSTVVHMRARRATRDVNLGGASIAAGDRVIAINGAANRDPARWERPAEFDPDRPRLWSHLAFNVGPRHCAGAHLARMEATETILGLFRAFPDVERASEPSSPPGSMGFVSRAWRPQFLSRAPIDRLEVRRRVLDGPAWAGSVPEAGS